VSAAALEQASSVKARGFALFNIPHREDVDACRQRVESMGGWQSRFAAIWQGNRLKKVKDSTN
jgi:hypothetical protein